MPESSRSDAPLRNPQYPQGANDESFSSGETDFTLRDGDLDTRHALPLGDIHGDSRVNRSAQTVGRTVGHAVSRVLRFPRHMDAARLRVRQAGRETRAKGAAVVLDMMDTAANRVDNLRRASNATISDWTQTARYRTSHLRQQTSQSLQAIRDTANERLSYARHTAVMRWNQTRRAVSNLQEEDPVRFLAMVAGTAFVIGAGVRIWRSRND